MDHARRHLLPGRRLARRRLPRRPRGLLLPPHVRRHQLSRLADEHVLAVEVTCSPRHRRPAERNITGVFQHRRRPANPGGIWRPVRSRHRPGRIDLAGCCAAMPTNNAPTCARRSPRQRPRSGRDSGLVDGDVRAEPALWRPGRTSRLERRRHRPHAVVALVARRAAPHRCRLDVLIDGHVSDRRSVRTGLRESRWTTGCARSTVSVCS